MAREGKQSFKVIDTDKKWILYHNCFSLCSRKVRLCLEELEIEYDQEHIDLIETGKYNEGIKYLKSIKEKTNNNAVNLNLAIGYFF